jgi:putative Mg2+ transporter-C (MgtC) family protein
MNPVDAIGMEQVCVRLAVAVLIGGVFGLNRELHGKPAGLRTHALVTLGASLATMLTLQSRLVDAGPDANALGRIIQGILTGVGFLGAGVILRDTAGHVTGLTTAATIWVCAGLGIACGLGYWSLVGVSGGLVLAVLLFGRRIELAAEHMFKRRSDEPPDHGV